MIELMGSDTESLLVVQTHVTSELSPASMYQGMTKGHAWNYLAKRHIIIIIIIGHYYYYYYYISLTLTRA
jgi:hypothetical protein